MANGKRRHLVQEGVDERKISVIRNGIEADFFFDPDSYDAHRARHMVRQKLGLREEFVLLYAGTLGMAHGIETLLRAAERLRHRGDITFVIVGAGAERDEICRLIGENRLSNVRLLAK